MTNKTTKSALLTSSISLLLCFAMLLGTTFAWFTDSVTSAGNIIQAGTLDVDLIDGEGKSMAGEIIEFVAADGRGQDEILWEPGCTYETEPVYVVNKGNLALKYEIAINGISGDAKLLEAIEWTVTVGGATTPIANLKGNLSPNETTGAIVLSGHMKEEAGNEYQDLSAGGISIAVVATQLEAEEDSFGPDYDADAEYDVVVASKSELVEAIANAEEGDVIALSGNISDVDANDAINVASGANVILDLNGYKLSAKANDSGNQELFLVKGTMTVKNGSLELVAENNQGWNAMTTLFDVTAGGVLSLEGVTATVSGSDMNFVVHLNNWGKATLNVNNCDFTTTYCGVRVFNSGHDMNNVTIKNTDFHVGRMLWVHNYTSEGADDSTLNLDIYGNNNTSDNAKPVRFGFNDEVYYNLDGNVIN